MLHLNYLEMDIKTGISKERRLNIYNKIVLNSKIRKKKKI